MNQEQLRIFETALSAMAEFKRTFGRDLKPEFITELYAAKELGLRVGRGVNEPGYDALGPRGERYEVKYRSAATLNVDVNSFAFDHLVLVNLDDDYRLMGMWRIPAQQAKEMFVWRERFRKYQATQRKVKSAAERIR